MSEVPLKPVGKKNIRALELALVLGSLLREDVLKQALEARDKVTWLDSLLVAAGALARERAGMPITQIAEELGRTEAAIRGHLQGKTEAGRIVREAYNSLVKSGGRLELALSVTVSSEECVKKIEELERRSKELEEKLSKAKESLRVLLSQL
uniref:Transcriptional regulator n=1 Tax=Fervidicoccus fontis TaxID=683846 RepID=A0A7J3ZKM4_9CREN